MLRATTQTFVRRIVTPSRRAHATNPTTVVVRTRTRAFAAAGKSDDVGDDPEAAKPLDATLIETMTELARKRKAAGETSSSSSSSNGVGGGAAATGGGKTTTVMASAETDEKWKALDDQVNEYPCMRKFQAIGKDGDGFVDSIVALISSALDGRSIHPENVSARPSSKGKYVSANVICEMRNGDEVVAVYKALKADPRVLWYL